MSNATSDEWTAALAAWHGLDENQRVYALGYLASGAPELMAAAAAAAADITTVPAPAAPATTAAANTAIAGLDRRGMYDVLCFLALHNPDAVLLAVRETGA
jgi:hypothetical protein